MILYWKIINFKIYVLLTYWVSVLLLLRFVNISWHSSVGCSIVTDSKKVSGSILGRVKIFVTTLNISELHHPKCGSNMINNFGEIVSSLLFADHTCRRSEDESWEGLLLVESHWKTVMALYLLIQKWDIWFTEISNTITTPFGRYI